MNRTLRNPAAPLYDPRFEHDACGLGFLARLDGRRDHELVCLALTALERMEHRGATGSDPETGDGAGIMLQLPDALLRAYADERLGGELPPPGDYAVAMAFLPRDASLRIRCEELCLRIAVEEGQRPLGWRDVPVDRSAIGELARQSEPIVRQLILVRGAAFDRPAFARKLAVIRRRVELAAGARRIPEASFSVISLSSDVVTYKGLLKAGQLGRYYLDLADPLVTSSLALIHSRFSTNTLGTWDLAHPFNVLAHNGEINTVRGNRAWIHAREPQLASPLLGDDLPKLFPLIEERWSDSAALDAALELLMLGGRSIAHAARMLVPPAWTGDPDLSEDLRAFYEYHDAVVEPWDGPAAIAFCDGTRIGALLDRSGLRPARYQVRSDGLVVFASEVGVLDLDPAETLECHRLGPGEMLLVDTETGTLQRSPRIEHGLAAQRPWSALLEEQRVALEDLPAAPAAPADPDDPLELDAAQRLFAYTQEDLELLVAPMAASGKEPVGSMGVDTPLSVLSRRAQLLPAFFKQHFAQVTNPAIDPQREGLVMSLRVCIGPRGNLLDERPEHARRVSMEQPVLRPGDLERLRALSPGRFRVATLRCLFDPSGGGQALERAVESLVAEASRLVHAGHDILVLSDRGTDASHAPIPILLATAAVHSHLVREGSRSLCGLVVESGEPREAMHYALLIGYGAAAVSPYLAFRTIAQLHGSGDLGELTLEEAQRRYVDAIGGGLLKVLSKMGIATLQSYRGAAIFEAVGLGDELVARFFPGTPSRIGGIGVDEVAADAAERHADAFDALPQPVDSRPLDPGGVYRHRLRGESHAWTPSSIALLQRAVRDDSPNSFRAYAEAMDAASEDSLTLRSLLATRPLGEPVPLHEVEPSSEIVRRFSTGAMSLGAISREAHETLAIATNRLGARSNSGEGGEDLARSIPDPNGDLRRSAIKQVASARFGVTASYLADADQLQIKIAQGAKPGEGGQLPGEKVDVEIARLRHSTPGLPLVSPPPHHDIYSIEDLAQLIVDLRAINPTAEISVKLVAEAGVGTIAAGVVKAGADHVTIAGHDGGTGAAALSSLQHAGVPWELGLAEAQQVLVHNALRGRARLQADGGLRTGRDVIVAALLGAEDFAFATAPLVAAGCVMMRVCHLGTCPVGIATQDPELRRRFAATPEHVMRYLLFVAEEVRERLAAMGARSLDEVIGRADLLRQRRRSVAPRAALLDLGPLLATADADARVARRSSEGQSVQPHGELERVLIAHARQALAAGEHVAVRAQVRTSDRTLGAGVSGEIVRHPGPPLADGAISLHLHGTAGQSLGAWGAAGLAIELDGLANDGVGKGLSGARIVVRPPMTAAYDRSQSAVIGNAALYGATSGELFVLGRAGERFAVRNSGATAVVEGAGDHCCEYMTGGVVVVLGRTGRNVAAGMTGGRTYIYDVDGRAGYRCNLDSVRLEPVDDDAELRRLVERHAELTSSELAADLLERWDEALPRFLRIVPTAVPVVLQTPTDDLALARG